MSYFWKPGVKQPDQPPLSRRIHRDFDDDNDQDVSLLSSRSSLYGPNQSQRLPVHEYRKAILYLVEKHATTVIVGETGSGKSTQIPQFLYEAGWAAGGRQIVCTQPRRVAVRTLAAHVAEQMGGSEVGYAVRFENATSENTRIKYVTDGLLIQEMMENPLLSSYGVIMVDEAHERSLATDLLLGLLKKVQRRRPDLRLVICSATLDAKEIADYFDATEHHGGNTRSVADRTEEEEEEEDGEKNEDSRDARKTCDLPSKKPAILSVEGRAYPVEILYLEEPTSNYLQCAVTTVIRIHQEEPLGSSGDILVFLTGQKEVETAAQMIHDEIHELPPNSRSIIPLPLYAGLPKDEVDKVFGSPTRRGHRKVVLSTNVAETSVTMEGIVYVIDSGFVKQKFYDPIRGVESLMVVPISRASAKQRAGRAGRVRPGKCFRLYTEEYFQESMEPRSIPEMERSDLTATVLQLKALGIDNIMRFDFLSPPPPEMMIRALEKLYGIGILGRDARLTPLGTRIAEVIPQEPMLAKMLIASGEMGCSEEVLTIAAALSVQRLWFSARNSPRELDAAKSRFAVGEGDLVTYLNVYEGFLRSKKSSKWCHENCLNYHNVSKVADIRYQLCRKLKRLGVPFNSCGTELEKVMKCITASLFMNAARLLPDGDGRTYQSIQGGNLFHIHPSSVLSKSTPKWVVYFTCRATDEAYIVDVSTIKMEWLTELAPHFYQSKEKGKMAV
ncbi:hypothetical protein CBR_g17902 [Chara braunii]|uniref:RNA helicase n=1 Tax=Chara braunii TaxID=69332 RepID=A0A388KVU8_CHABU|nr:hypothetical protein CBR_g17902 [Chara braunii]|eukprot:GBG74190.1 hypothetical protein CBR_g17902 [Chara braunii]